MKNYKELISKLLESMDESDIKIIRHIYNILKNHEDKKGRR